MAVYLGSNRVCTQGGTKNITGSGIDTSDATATASDIVEGKTAYVKGNKITGNVLEVTDSNGSLFGDAYYDSRGRFIISATQPVEDVLYRKGATVSTYVSGGSLGDAKASDVVAGKTFTSSSGIKITGSHSCSSGSTTPTLQSKSVSPSESSQTVTPDSGYDGLSQVTVSAISNTYVGSGITKKAAATYTPSTSNQTIASGQYLNGAQTIKGDSNLVASNIKSGVSIFGVSGSYTASSSGTDTSDATATASDILSGKTAYVKGSKITGTIASQAAQTITPGTSDKTIASGKYLSGTQTIKGDANLVASNIKSGVSIFGVAGSYTGSGGSGSSTNNCEAYHITSTSATINFQGSGTVKVFGYGAKKSTYMTTIYSFVGDGYYAGTSYGTPSKTTASFSVSGGTLSGLPSGLTAVDLLVVIGV